MKDMRIQKALSEAGVLSRRKAEALVEEGKVTVNGRPATLGMKIDPRRDRVAVDGQAVELTAREKRWYVALNKPRGYVTTTNDELGRRCVMELVEDIPGRVYPIGRLDRNSEGLLLFTNDGEFANQIMHPRGEISKTYRVTVHGDVKEEQLITLSQGVEIESGMTLPAQVSVLDKAPGRTVLQIVINEGKNRQIRRMCEAVGLTVARLRRTAVGAVRLGMLAPGKWREITAQELSALRAMSQKGAPPAPKAPSKREAPKKPAPRRPTR